MGGCFWLQVDEGCPHECKQIVYDHLTCIILQVDSLDEHAITQKIGCYKTHETTMDFTLENFDHANNGFKTMLENAQKDK